jgi:hypothetical protein
MKYMLLIYDDTKVWEKFSEEQRKQGMDMYMKFTQEVKSGGHYVSSNQLQPASVATSVRTRDANGWSRTAHMRRRASNSAATT